jgi:NAD(P)-dependent dehydrogenase (short-subunit alcohol dehydrogenase family)
MSPTKHVIVTGSARGIGRCIARTALEKGWKVFMLDIIEVSNLHVMALLRLESPS